MKRKGTPDAWVFRWYEYKNEKRRYLKQIRSTIANTLFSE